MQIVKEGERIARWAEEFGYSVMALFTTPGSINVTLTHPEVGTRRVRIAEYGSCDDWADWSVDPTGLQTWEVVKKLAQESGAKRPAWVTRAQRREALSLMRLDQRMANNLVKTAQQQLEAKVGGDPRDRSTADERVSLRLMSRDAF